MRRPPRGRRAPPGGRGGDVGGGALRCARLPGVGGVVPSAASLSPAPAAVGHEVAPVPPLDFDPPRPGTYTLHRIMRAPDGEVLGLDGRGQRLSHFTRGRITLLGFIYTTCTDPDGCPLAYRVFETLKQAIEARHGFAEAR